MKIKDPNSRINFRRRSPGHFPSAPNRLRNGLRLALVFWTALLAGQFCKAEGVPVQFETQDGRTLSGKFLGSAGDELQIELAQEKSTPSAPEITAFPVRTLRVLRFSPVPPPESVSTTPNSSGNGNNISTTGPEEETSEEMPKELPSVQLGDTLLKVRSITLKDGTFQLEPAGGGNAAAKSGEVAEILFQPSRLGTDKDLDADWEEIRNQETEEDMLIVFRNEKLNFYYGTILEITNKAVRFEQDGESINVRLRHIFALRFTSITASAGSAAQQENQITDPAFREKPLLGVLTDAFGSELSVSCLEFPETDRLHSANSDHSTADPTPGGSPNAEEMKLRCITTTGHVLDLPIKTLRVLDLTHGRTLFLTDLKPESVEWTPYFPLTSGLLETSFGTRPETQAQTSSETAQDPPNTTSSEMENSSFFDAARTFYAPRLDQGFSGKAIRLAGKEYANGLELTSRTKMVFRLPGQFQKFETTLGIDDHVRPEGSVEISILADERLLFRETITGKDAPKSLSLDISGARRLTILVDFGEKGSLSDHAAFANAQLVK